MGYIQLRERCPQESGSSRHNNLRTTESLSQSSKRIRSLVVVLFEPQHSTFNVYKRQTKKQFNGLDTAKSSQGGITQRSSVRVYTLATWERLPVTLGQDYQGPRKRISANDV